MTTPRFPSREALQDWEQDQVLDFMLDAPFSRNLASLMLRVANRIRIARAEFEAQHSSEETAR